MAKLMLRRRLLAYFIAVPVIILFYRLSSFQPAPLPGDPSWSKPSQDGSSVLKKQTAAQDDGRLTFWQTVPTHYPVTNMTALPSGQPLQLPRIQHPFRPESPAQARTRLYRQRAVRNAFIRCWNTYKSVAWLYDEATPVSGSFSDSLGGWGDTLIASLDTLWIMGLRTEFELAVSAVTETLSFDTTDLETVNVFETTVRFLGGLLSAYDLSGDERLLMKAKELGEMLYVAFDTPNRLPVTRWDPHRAAQGVKQEAGEVTLLAEMGSLTMEFARLSVLTGDPRWYDAVRRVMGVLAEQQMGSRLPGLWPIVGSAKDGVFNTGTTFSMGAMADTTYEYLPKMHALLGGLDPVFGEMYERAMDAAMTELVFRPMLPKNEDLLMLGSVDVEVWDDNDEEEETDDGDWQDMYDGGWQRVTLRPESQHVACFAGGMSALGGKLFKKHDHLATAHKLTDGCIWAYKAMPLGIMPESFWMLPCESRENDKCAWNETQWREEVLRLGMQQTENSSGADNMRRADAIISKQRLPRGFTHMVDRRYLQRPEAIESIFVLYRTTGREDLVETAWRMFLTVHKHTRTNLANSGLDDVTTDDAMMIDSMEVFWMGETLKYFYLMFSEPDYISLDEYVFNTEAHPLKRLHR
jgi:mannosyl-oligosaccharide alpha-1,2-mannosidase